MPRKKQARESARENPKQIVFNERNQPVELHYASKVVILPPRGQAELEQQDLDSIQFQTLHARGLLTTRPASDITSAEPPAPKTAPKRKPRRRRAPHA
ncbi:MAG: hypothetical protein HY741_05765 [Chloroflexi bacterium]|nr:hypothetical protein [Chloroflexota bacterium]